MSRFNDQGFEFGDPAEEQSRWRRVVTTLDSKSEGWRRRAAYLGDAAVSTISDALDGPLVQKAKKPDFFIVHPTNTVPHAPKHYSLADARKAAEDLAVGGQSYTVFAVHEIGSAKTARPAIVWEPK